MFYYHMFGLSVGSLAVKTKGTSLPETVTWIKYYSQGNRWHHAGVDIPSIEGLQVKYTNCILQGRMCYSRIFHKPTKL